MKLFIIVLTVIWFITVLVNFSRLNVFLTVFILLAAIERFWETFLVSKQNILAKKSEFDWLFKIISYYYIAIMFGTILEHVLLKRALNSTVVIIGFWGFILALLMRLWSIKMLGGRWNTCVLGKIKRKFRPAKLIKKGPYRYFRHPIYLGAILEAVSLPLVFNSYYTVIFAALMYVPLIILRAYLEENEMVRIFGANYVKYKNKTVGL
jgi:methyltransferase